MSKRLWSMFAIGSSLVLATGCPTRTEPKQDPPPKIVEERAPKDDMPPPHEAPVGIQKVTLHIPQMAERQGLT